jgi:hypothetical protein
MGRNKDIHDLVQETLGRWVIRKQSISIHVVKLTLVGVWESFSKFHHTLCGVQAQKASQPTLDGVVVAVSDWLFQNNLFQTSSLILEFVLLSELRNELEGQRSTCAFITVDCR